MVENEKPDAFMSGLQQTLVLDEQPERYPLDGSCNRLAHNLLDPLTAYWLPHRTDKSHGAYDHLGTTFARQGVPCGLDGLESLKRSRRIYPIYSESDPRL